MNIKFSKTIKILFVFEIILIVSIAILSLNNGKEMPTAYAVKESINTENISFKMLTKTVCEKKSENLFCHDELFIRCNGREYMIQENNLNEFIECNNLKLKMSDIINSSDKLKKG